MVVKQAFHYELNPNNSQRIAFAKHAGAGRFVWNRALELLKSRLDAGERLDNAIELHREWNEFKRENAPWWTEVSKCAPQESLRDLDKAMKTFFKSRKTKGARRVGFPKFKRKGVKDSFRLTGSVHVGEDWVKLPRIGKVRTNESTDKFLVSGARILSATVKREADRWFLSLTVEVERPDPKPVVGPVVGIDRGLTNFAVFSGWLHHPKPQSLGAWT